MSVDHSTPRAPEGPRPIFLGVKPGMTVIVRKQPEDIFAAATEEDWWMGQVVFCEGSARDSKAPSLFQIADVDSGVIRWVNADLVLQVLPG